MQLQKVAQSGFALVCFFGKTQKPFKQFRPVLLLVHPVFVRAYSFLLAIKTRLLFLKSKVYVSKVEANLVAYKLNELRFPHSSSRFCPGSLHSPHCPSCFALETLRPFCPIWKKRNGRTTNEPRTWEHQTGAKTAQKRSWRGFRLVCYKLVWFEKKTQRSIIKIVF